jgi:hypothetical protein
MCNIWNKILVLVFPYLLYVNIVAYLLSAGTVKQQRQPLLENGSEKALCSTTAS